MNAIDIYAIKYCRQLSLKLIVHRMLTSLWMVNECVLWCVYSHCELETQSFYFLQITDELIWEDFLSDFKIPQDCSNGTQALKFIYVR